MSLLTGLCLHSHLYRRVQELTWPGNPLQFMSAQSILTNILTNPDSSTETGVQNVEVSAYSTELGPFLECHFSLPILHSLCGQAVMWLKSRCFRLLNRTALLSCPDRFIQNDYPLNERCRQVWVLRPHLFEDEAKTNVSDSSHTKLIIVEFIQEHNGVKLPQ